MDKILHGIVHGQTIELTEPAGLAEGQKVEVVVRFSTPSRPCGEGIRNSAGALATSWTEEDDRILEEIQRERKLIQCPQMVE